MKKIATLLLLVLITSMSFGQGNYQDVVYLKNGSIIRGIIIEQVPNQSIKIETSEGNVFFYSMKEIEKLTKELNNRNSGFSSSNSELGLQSGYIGFAELGYLIGNDDRLKLNIINAYQINPHFSLGLGTGLRYYTGYYEAAIIPIFADVRANLINRKNSPYVSLGIGYSFDATNDFDGVGMLVSPSIGYRFKISENSTMNIGLEYEIQRMKYFRTDGYYYDVSTGSSGALGIYFGINF